MQQVANLVHNRFLIWSEVKTEAVLHYDDDVLAPLEDLEAGFNIWRSHRHQMVGFEPRVILCEGDDARIEAERAAEADNASGRAVDGLLPSIVGKVGGGMPQDCHYRFMLRHAYFDIVVSPVRRLCSCFRTRELNASGLDRLASCSLCRDS